MKLEYFIVLGVCLAGPLALSFSKKLTFYKNPIRLVLAILIPMIVFIAWDMFAAMRGHWGFNTDYITGFFIFNLPVEEILFFAVIPFAGLFTWEVVKYFAEKKK
jgi:lycopene cyclase domain-containing protein